jgi:phosphoglycolate phosphatase
MDRSSPTFSSLRPDTATPLAGSASIEVLNPSMHRGKIRCALFDFDGTISLIRRGWQEIMVSMMVEILVDLKTGRPVDECKSVVADFVTDLTGRQTIFQMIRLCEIISEWGGSPQDPTDYKSRYDTLLLNHIRVRRAGLSDGSLSSSSMMVPGSGQLLHNLVDRGIELILASGTDLKYVLEEAELLGVAHYFDGQIHGALPNYHSFSKRTLVKKLVGFGDGFVEIEETHQVGGVAVGVASDEDACEEADQWKRTRLVAAGADIIVPGFREQELMVDYLLGASRLPVVDEPRQY